MRRASFLAVLLFLFPHAAWAVTGPFTSRIAFVSDRDGNNEIYLVASTGFGHVRLTDHPASDTEPAFSRDGQRVAFTSNRDGQNEIHVVNADGSNLQRVTNDLASDTQPAWSPDGRKIVFTSTRQGNSDIFIMNFVGTNLVQLTNDQASDFNPVFSPDGSRIFFVSTRDGVQEIYTMNVDGSAQTRVTFNDTFEARPDISPDGRLIVFDALLPTGTGSFTRQIVLTNADGTSPRTLTSQANNANPTFTVDGRIFFDSTRDGNNEVYSMSLTGTDVRRLATNAAADSAPSSFGRFEVETVGVYRPSTGQWLFRRTNTSGPADYGYTFGGRAGDVPVAGNWNGDKFTDIAIYRDNQFILGTVTIGDFGVPFVQSQAPIAFGEPGDVPVVGDWDGDGIDDLGVFRPGSPGRFILRTRRFPVTFDFGEPGDLPIAGDWDGDGIDTPGVFRPSSPGLFLLTNGFDSTVEIEFAFGDVGQLPVAGDWLGRGADRVGVFAGGAGFALAFELISKTQIFVDFGQPGDIPVAGNW